MPQSRDAVIWLAFEDFFPDDGPVLLMGKVSIINLAAGQSLFKEGDPGDTMYVVKEGKVDLLLKNRVVDVAGPGSVLGEMALIDKAGRSATAVAQTDCVLLPINENQFQTMIKQTPAFAAKVMRIMCERLRRMDGIK